MQGLLLKIKIVRVLVPGAHSIKLRDFTLAIYFGIFF